MYLIEFHQNESFKVSEVRTNVVFSSFFQNIYNDRTHNMVVCGAFFLIGIGCKERNPSESRFNCKSHDRDMKWFVLGFISNISHFKVCEHIAEACSKNTNEWPFVERKYKNECHYPIIFTHGSKKGEYVRNRNYQQHDDNDIDGSSLDPLKNTWVCYSNSFNWLV